MWRVTVWWGFSMEDFTSNADSLDGDFKALLVMRRNKQKEVTEEQEKVTKQLYNFWGYDVVCEMYIEAVVKVISLACVIILWL